MCILIKSGFLSDFFGEFTVKDLSVEIYLKALTHSK